VEEKEIRKKGKRRAIYKSRDMLSPSSAAPLLLLSHRNPVASYKSRRHSPVSSLHVSSLAIPEEQIIVGSIALIPQITYI
jgi:hypothetical protein